MAKNKTEYVCRNCGAISPKWSGQCSECGDWNTLEEQAAANKAVGSPRHTGYAGVAAAEIMDLKDFDLHEERRLQTGVSELDRVLGGGLVPGSVILLGGDPGIGKSTLLLQVTALLKQALKPIYVTGEESLGQVAMRAQRLGLEAEGLRCLAETCVETVLAKCQESKPGLLVMDSIQTIYTQLLQSAPGSVAQVRESAAQLVRYAKQTGTTVILVGHVTKEGALAGPRVLEHMVDTVLYFEGDHGSRFRVIRGMKNRFGAVNELGVFAMTDQGLKAVNNPSAIFLSGHPGPVPGSMVMVTREGTRPLLVEVQALVDQSQLGNPRRVTVGLEQNRLSLLLAVLHRHVGLALGDQDVFVNVVGGMRLSETASDLPLLLSVLSSFKNRAMKEGLIAFGEIGLSGEIRPVSNGEERLNEAQKHGFTTALIPKGNQPRKVPKGMTVLTAERLEQAVDLVF